jgi:DNA-binding NarL/FixJ family response regulator
MTTGPALGRLTRREHQVLTLMAEGRSNVAIGEQLTVEVKTVETHISRVFTKLGLAEVTGENRRVLAVLTYLRPRLSQPPPEGRLPAEESI